MLSWSLILGCYEKQGHLHLGKRDRPQITVFRFCFFVLRAKQCKRTGGRGYAVLSLVISRKVCYYQRVAIMIWLVSSNHYLK